MGADISSYVTVLTDSTNAVSAMIASLVTLFGVLRFRRRARAEIAPAAVVRGSAGGGLATLLYVSNAVPHDMMANPGSPSGTIYAPQGTVTKLPRWATSTFTPLAIIVVLLFALFDMQRTSHVERVPVHIAPVITDARAFISEYDPAGTVVSGGRDYIVIRVNGTWDGTLATLSSIPATPSERSDFTWVSNLKELCGTGCNANDALFGSESPANLVAARLKLRTGGVSTDSIAHVGGDTTPGADCMVFVYALGLGDDVHNTGPWTKIGEGRLDPSGSWSVVGTVSSDRSRTVTSGSTAKISLAAIVVSPKDASDGKTPEAKNTMSLADLGAMGRSEIVTVVPHRGLQRGQVTDDTVGGQSRTTPATGVSRRR